tara:strand:+ start:217 stop:420 length:204 start_codon:yes stop_codon:yes gene_type:complete
MKWDVTDDDRNLLKELYGLNKDQISRAEKSYYRSEKSLCACAKLIFESEVVNVGTKGHIDWGSNETK